MCRLAHGFYTSGHNGDCVSHDGEPAHNYGAAVKDTKEDDGHLKYNFSIGRDPCQISEEEVGRVAVVKKNGEKSCS